MNTPAAINLADMRSDYARASLNEADVAADPIAQFDKWLKEAISARCPEPTAMSLATADAAGRPSSRIVLLKGVDARGFVFFTNYESRKGRDLAENPRAALLFHWVELERELRIEGRVEKASDAETEAYFASRPLQSRVGAWASPQSQEIPGRAWLEHSFAEAEKRLGAAPPPPPHWGGYRVVPERLEFWQGRKSRLHDRLVYSHEGSEEGGQREAGWRISRLAP